MIMKYILYAVTILLSLIIVCLTSMMSDRVFNVGNMRETYYNGCNLGMKMASNKPIDSVRCNKAADLFKEVLDVE
jgi:hypothetical protein